MLVVEEAGSIPGAAGVAERVVAVVEAQRISFDDPEDGDDDGDEEDDEEDDESRNIGARHVSAPFV